MPEDNFKANLNGQTTSSNKKKRTKNSWEKKIFGSSLAILKIKKTRKTPYPEKKNFFFFFESFVFFQSLSSSKLAPFGIFWNQKALPSGWSLKDRWNWLDKKKRFDWGDIETSPCNLRITYRGLGRSDEDAASIRADKLIPDYLPLFYYEVKVLSIGEFGYIGIGLCSPYVDLDRLPGWEKDSLGYHGDDGHAFRDSGTGIPYGPSFATGDVIGVCFSPINKKIFFTKNGKPLSSIFCDVFENKLLPNSPMVGLRTSGETIEINFGKKPFEFDLNAYLLNIIDISTRKVYFLGNFTKSKIFKNEAVNKKLFIEKEQNIFLSNIETNLLVFNELLGNNFSSAGAKLLGSFWKEKNILNSPKGLELENNWFSILERMTGIICSVFQINKFFCETKSKSEKVHLLFSKIFLTFPEVLNINSFRKTIKSRLKKKRLEGEKLIKDCKYNIGFEILTNLPLKNNNTLQEKNRCKLFCPARTRGVFPFIIYELQTLNMGFLLGFLEMILGSLKKKNSKTFSIFSHHSLKFLVTFSHIKTWFI